MIHKRQKLCACYATALWQIGAIGDEALSAYSRHVVPAFAKSTGELFRACRRWKTDYAPNILDFDQLTFAPTGIDSESLKLTGRGIVILSWNSYQHSISYEDGIVLDPFDDIPQPQSLSEYLSRYPNRHVVQIIPIPKEDSEHV